MNGFELYTELRQIDRTFKICFITVFEPYYQSIREFFPTLDVDCFLKKPISVIELCEHIERKLWK
jgi:two-component system catabolic regulation response regulator CreB/two-component system response regulator ChvI